ncbi:site-2 protease family protein [Clostridium paraputrificum]|uniref:site-2 protease family protein n=1 Tax=Clostridium TaxID=1485 RepID=UPI003D337341
MDYILDKLYIIPAIVLAFTFHEYAHAKMADRLGDKTPRFQGRLTLNPIKHIDPLGALLILLVGFGWAKPVQTNPSAYKNYYKDDLKVTLAGPLANLVLGFLGCLIYGLLVVMQANTEILPIGVFRVLVEVLWAVFSINISLFIFNLLPVPGLDGFAILRDIKPNLFYNIQESLYRYQNIILLGILLVGSNVIMVPVKFIMKTIMAIVSSLLGLIF